MYAKPLITNKTMTLANTEYNHTFQDNCKKILVRERSGGEDVKIAWVSGESGTNYFTLGAGSTKAIDGFHVYARIMYFQCTAVGKILEIEEWIEA